MIECSISAYIEHTEKEINSQKKARKNPISLIESEISMIFFKKTGRLEKYISEFNLIPQRHSMNNYTAIYIVTLIDLYLCDIRQASIIMLSYYKL